MKSDIHPAYDYVAFRDINTREVIVTRSTLTSDKTIEVDGRGYPLVDVEITAASHPFWTGTKRAIDTAGRIEKFNERYGKAAARGKSA